jgi:hypothetical protein
MRQNAEIAADLRAAVDEGVALIAAVPETATTRRPDNGGWCVREVIGHLIDSACNNHRRFIINQSAASLVVDPYDQDDWIARQHYAEQRAAQLIALWAMYNRHLASVIAAVPEEVATRVRGDAELDFPFTQPPSTAPTLANLADDYVGHLRHHLRQIAALLSSV